MRRLVAIALLAICASAVPAEAATSPKRCGVISVNGRSYTVMAHVVGCDFAKTWSRRYLARRSRPSGWSCRRYDSRETRVAFLCRRSGRDYYAIRR